MAYLVKDSKISAVSEGAATTLTVELATHQVDDLLFFAVTQDGGSGTLSVTGWTAIGTQAASAGIRHVWFYKVATSSSETSPTVSSTLSEELAGTTFVVRDIDTSTPIHASAKTDAAGAIASPSLTTTVDNCLLLYSFAFDNNYQKALVQPTNVIFVDRNDATTTFSQIVGYHQQHTAGAVPSITAGAVVNDGGTGWVIAVKNATSGNTMPALTSVVTSILQFDDFTVTAPTTGLLSDVTTTINGITVNTAGSTAGTAVTSGLAPGTIYRLYGTNAAISNNWWGITFSLAAATNLLDKQIIINWGNLPFKSSPLGPEGYIVTFSDASNNWVAFRLLKTIQIRVDLPYAQIIDLSYATPLDSGGTLDWTAVTKIGFGYHRVNLATNFRYVGLSSIWTVDKAVLVGGSTASPINANTISQVFNGCGFPYIIDGQGVGQTYSRTSLQIGDGSRPTKYVGLGTSIEFPTENDLWKVTDLGVSFTVYASASDVIDFAGASLIAASKQSFALHASTSTAATYAFTGSTFIGFEVTWRDGVTCDGALFQECYKITANGGLFDSCTIRNAKDTVGITTDNLTDITNNSFISDGTGYAIEFTGAAGNYTLDGNEFTGYASTDGTTGNEAIHVTATTGTINITVTNGSAPTIHTEGATVNILAPTFSRGLAFTGLVAGSKVKVFETGTDTELFSTASSSTTETWSEETTGSITVDYVVMKAGYVPIRVTGITVTAAETGGVVSTPIQQVLDRAYVASSGLTINTNVFLNTTTKKWGLTTASTLQNLYSYLIEQWITLGDEGEAFANVAFPLVTNGPNSFSWLNGWEADTTTYTSSITNLSRDGMRYLDTGGTVTAMWAAILSVGVPTGKLVRFQQSDGGTTIDANATGNIDQLIQIYGDATHGNFDYTGYLVAKLQADGYDQVEVNIVTQYGSLDDQLFVIGLTPVANTVATGNPALAAAPTITDHGASPVTWNGKSFSITITDSAAGNTGEDIMNWLRYNFETGGTFQGKNAFNWHDLVQQNGSDFKTVRGILYGDTGATLKGVRVVQNDGTSIHPDFTLFTADDGTTYAPPPSATVTVGPFITGSRVQLYDTDNNVELFNDVVTGTSKVFSETYTVDRTVRARIAYVNGTSAKQFIEATVGTLTSASPNISVILTQVDDVVYNTNAVDGSAVTGVTFTDAATDKVNIDIASGETNWQDIYAAFAYWIFTATGITDDIAYIDAVDTANYILTDMVIKNTSSPTVPLAVSGGYGRDSVTGASIDLVDTTGGTLIFAPDHVVAKIVTVGGANVITGDIADITADLTVINNNVKKASLGIPAGGNL